MARRWIPIGAALLMLLIALPAAAAGAPPVTVAELLADPSAYAAPEVPEITVRGELVGDFGRRPGGEVWVQLNGDAYVDSPLLDAGLSGGNLGIGVRIPAELWPGFAEPGGYRRRGPVVVLTGAWRYHDPGRGGESYLAVTALVVEQPARPLHDRVDWVVFGVGMALIAAAAALWQRHRSGQRVR